MDTLSEFSLVTISIFLYYNEYNKGRTKVEIVTISELKLAVDTDYDILIEEKEVK